MEKEREKERKLYGNWFLFDAWLERIWRRKSQGNFRRKQFFLFGCLIEN